MKIAERFWHPYYVLNTLISVTYVVLRFQLLDPGELGTPDPFGITREIHIYVSLALLVLVRLLSAPTIDAYLATCFMFVRVAVLLCLWYMDARACLVFLALWTLVFVVYPQPRFKHSASILVLNNVTFDQRITGNKSQTINVIWAHATWSSRCTQLAPVLADLAAKYKHPRLRFCKIDVSRWPQIAEKLRISLSATSDQLPAVVCFKQGVETDRVPAIDEIENPSSKYRRGFTAAHVARQLKLDLRMQEAEKWEAGAKQQYQSELAARSKMA
jgi:thiol-disulfide isomerase/thioredoxin